MARIQKKKTASKKIKTQKGVAADSSAAAVDAVKTGSDKNGSGRSNGVSGAEKKKKVIAAKRTSGYEQSAVMKLAEKHFGTWIQFFREVRVELTKVTWPSKKQTIGSTAVVIVFVFVIAIFLGMVDIGLSNLIRLIL